MGEANAWIWGNQGTLPSISDMVKVADLQTKTFWKVLLLVNIASSVAWLS